MYSNSGFIDLITVTVIYLVYGRNIQYLKYIFSLCLNNTVFMIYFSMGETFCIYDIFSPWANLTISMMYLVYS